MEKVIQELNLLAHEDVSTLSVKDQETHYKETCKSLDILMNKKDIDLDDYESLMEIKAFVLSKIKNLKID